MKSLVRNFTHTFRRFWVTSTLNFFGLVIALVAFFLFSTKVDEQLRYNRCFDDYEKIYRVELQGSMFDKDSICIANVIAPLGDVAKKVKHVEDAMTMPLNQEDISFFRDGKFVVSVPCIGAYGKQLNFWRKGIAPDTLSSDYPVFVTKRDGMIIPKSFAKKWFGTTDVVGKDLKWELEGTKHCFKVVSVYDDFPKNCCVHNAIYRYGIGRDSLTYTNYNYHVYVKVDSPSNVPYVEKAMLKQLLQDMREHGDIMSDDELEEMLSRAKGVKIRLTQNAKTYFSGVDDVSDKGDMNMLAILFVSAIFVIIISNVNMMNMSLAQAPFRIKNINTRRVFGANRWVLTAELMLETLLVCFAAFVIAMIVLYFGNYAIVGNINPLDHKNVVRLTIYATLYVAILSGAYPAYFATSFPPAIAMKGLKDIPMRSRRLRNIRISFQLIISYIAIECVLIYLLQTFFIYHADYGYQKEHIVYGELNSMESVAKKDEVRDELLKIEGVEDICYSRFAIGTSDRYMMWSRKPRVGEDPVLFTVMPVGKEYFNTMGIKIDKGRGFVAKDSIGAYIVNEAALKKYPWIELNKGLFLEDDEINLPVVGVCTNVRFNSMRKNDEVEPLLFMYSTNPDIENTYNRGTNMINIRIADDAKIEGVMKKINEKYMAMFPEEPSLYLTTLDEKLGQVYHNEFLFFLQTCMLAILYIVLTMIGVSSTIAFENEYHRKEMGIRRVFGASIWNITFIKAHLYIILNVVSFLVSIPFVNFISEYTLAGFVQICPYTWYAFPIGFVLVASIGLSLIFVQRYFFAKDKPVNSIYNE